MSDTIASQPLLQQISICQIGTSCSRKSPWSTHYSIACSITALPFVSTVRRYEARSLRHLSHLRQAINPTKLVPPQSNSQSHRRPDTAAESGHTTEIKS